MLVRFSSRYVADKSANKFANSSISKTKKQQKHIAFVPKHLQWAKLIDVPKNFFFKRFLFNFSFFLSTFSSFFFDFLYLIFRNGFLWRHVLQKKYLICRASFSVTLMQSPWNLERMLKQFSIIVYRKESLPSKESKTKILQSIHFAYLVGTVNSYSNRRASFLHKYHFSCEVESHQFIKPHKLAAIAQC